MPEQAAPEPSGTGTHDASALTGPTASLQPATGRGFRQSHLASGHMPGEAGGAAALGHTALSVLQSSFHHSPEEQAGAQVNLRTA